MFQFLLGPRFVSQPTSFGPSTADVKLAAEQATMEVERRLESLELACAGLWELLKNKHGYTEEELIQAIREVDARDGTVDGKLNTGTRKCPACQRPQLTKKSPKCSWCGAEMSSSPF